MIRGVYLASSKAQPGVAELQQQVAEMTSRATDAQNVYEAKEAE